jgi:hypothetical protein
MRRRRRRNPISDKQLMYIGAGIAVLGVGYILWSQNQGPQQVVNAQGQPVAAGSLPAAPSNILALGADAVAYYQQCVVSGGSTATCVAQTVAQYGAGAVSGVSNLISSL